MRKEWPIIDYAGKTQPERSIWDGGWLLFLLYIATVLGLMIVVAAAISLVTYY